jgi:hypothetical protein
MADAWSLEEKKMKVKGAAVAEAARRAWGNPKS